MSTKKIVRPGGLIVVEAATERGQGHLAHVQAPDLLGDTSPTP